MQQELFKALYETCLMVFFSGIITLIFGLALAVFLRLLSLNLRILNLRFKNIKHNFIKQKLRENLNKMLKYLIQVSLSLPYVVLMIALLPLTGQLLGNEPGWWVAVLPLSLASIPYFASHCEKILTTVPASLIEWMIFMGANPMQIIFKVLLPETWSRLMQTWILTLIQLLGYSAIAGLLGATGLGSLAIQKGYPEFQMGYIISTALLFILLIQGLEWLGHYFAKKTSLTALS